MEDRELIQEVISGNTSAFRSLVEEYQGRVFNACLNVLHDREDAEDVAQEVFIEVFNSLRTFRGDSKLSTWIYRIAVSKSLDLVRWKKRKKRFAVVQSLFDPDAGEPEDRDRSGHPGIRLEEKERRAVLFDTIDRLAENQRAALLLYCADGLSYKEISEVLRISVPAVESLIFRARTTLKKKLNDYYTDNL
jgi:RNA polymerase sigma-70 factor (ECF subfamily)